MLSKGRKALGIRRAHPEALGALAAPVTVVMVMVPMVTAPMVAALPTDKQQANHQQPHPVFYVPRPYWHRAPLSLGHENRSGNSDD
jgi:hypothetical protein